MPCILHRVVHNVPEIFQISLYIKTIYFVAYLNIFPYRITCNILSFLYFGTFTTKNILTLESILTYT